MLNIFSLIKTLAITFLVVWGLQFKVSGKRIEQHAYEFSTDSSLAQYLTEVAQGAVVILKESTTKISGFFKGTIDQQAPDVIQAGRLQLDIKRSSGYQKQSQDN